MAVLTVIGIAVLPSLDIRYLPESTSEEISVYYDWLGVSSRIVEAEATSKIEGVLSGIRNCTDISSRSADGEGSIWMKFRKGTDMAAVRFEVASRIRNIYPDLPDGLSYPWISLNVRGTGSGNDLSFVFKSSRPSLEIDKFVRDEIYVQLSEIPGVDVINIYGSTPYEVEILFDFQKAAEYGFGAVEIENAIASGLRTYSPGRVRTESGMTVVTLEYGDRNDIAGIPVGKSGGKIIRISDVATISYKESEPQTYFRLNGLNTVYLNVGIAPGTNLLTVAADVRDKVAELQGIFPEDITVTLDYDSSEYIAAELRKIIFRTLLCILILIAFVWIVYKSFRYTAIIFITLLVNLFTAAVIYKLTGLGIHLYTLAGISVSLGIIIDSSIVMADHYSHFRNRSVFPALLGATATTIGALCVIMLLPDEDKKNLADFSKVIIINLSVALVTAYAFIPSLIDKLYIPSVALTVTDAKKRRIIRANSIYAKYIGVGRNRKWVAAIVLVAIFGIPLCLIPEDTAAKWPFYSQNKDSIDKIAGGTFAMFYNSLNRGNFYREPGRDVLYVQAGMPEGCSVAQLDEVVKSMENYLSRFDEIESFTTNISSYDNAVIEIRFKPEHEATSFPAELKSSVMAVASNFGGANWRVWGVNDSYFNNNVSMSYKNCRIILKGYNYDELLVYADTLIHNLSKNRRVSGPEPMNGWNEFARTEFNMEYDFEHIAALGLNPYGYFSALSSRIYEGNVGNIMYGDAMTPLVLRSSDRDSFDLWHIENTGIEIDSTKVKLSEIGSVTKTRSGLTIYRDNQAYKATIGFDFIGSFELSQKVMDENIKFMNEQVLPIGYKAEAPDYYFMNETFRRYGWLILLVIAIIYVMSCMVFESLRLPFAVILMIPVSFVGIFLTFGLSDFVFDQGGFAAFVMLSGIVVNAGIYIINECETIRKSGAGIGRNPLKTYIKAFNRKIHPILLTVLSTVLGLIPFLFDGPKEVFWFDFAIGTISGLLFSLLALVLCLPLFLLKRNKK